MDGGSQTKTKLVESRKGSKRRGGRGTKEFGERGKKGEGKKVGREKWEYGARSETCRQTSPIKGYRVAVAIFYPGE